MIEYEEISEPLLVHFESKDMDLLQVGILNSSLHEILNQVAITILNEENEELERNGKNRLLEYIPQSLGRQDVLVRARIIGVSEGSIELYIQPLLAQIFSEPTAVAILQNLVANALWAIGEYGRRVAGCYITRSKGLNYISRPLPEISARHRLRPRVENLVKHLKEASNGGRIVLKTEDEELIVEFYPPDSQQSRRK